MLIIFADVTSCHITWDISGPGTTPLSTAGQSYQLGFSKSFSIKKKVVAFKNGRISITIAATQILHLIYTLQLVQTVISLL